VTKNPLGRVTAEWAGEVVGDFDIYFWQMSQNQSLPENDGEGRSS